MLCLVALSFPLCQVYVAAFAVSGYAPFAHRAKYKPFNPVLGETYECIREDRGFKYISEQVSLIVTWVNAVIILFRSVIIHL